MEFKTNVYVFMRGKRVIDRRMKINKVERIVRDEPRKRRHFSIKEVTEMLNDAGIRVSDSNLRRWIRLGLCPAIKKSRKKVARWWLLPSHVIELCERMHTLSEWYDRYKEMRRTRIRYVSQERQLPPRDHMGRFTKRKKDTTPYYDHSHMMPRLQ